MAKKAHSFKRLVLGLQPGAPNRAIPLAVEMAGLLELELLGLFFEDTGLHDLAALPFAREFRPLGGGWHPLNADRLSHDLMLVARSAGRMFESATNNLATKCEFQVLRGAAAASIAAVSRAGDIVMLAESPSPAERSTSQFSHLMDEASRSSAAVMLVPPHLARTRGPIIVMSGAPDDPGTYAAAAIAEAANEELVILEADEFRGTAQRAFAADAPYTTGRTVHGLTLPDFGARRIRTVQERLVILTTDAFAPEAALSIANLRRVPVLLIRSPGAPGDSPPPP